MEYIFSLPEARGVVRNATMRQHIDSKALREKRRKRIAMGHKPDDHAVLLYCCTGLPGKEEKWQAKKTPSSPATAPMVKRIFTLCADGMGPSKIAQQLEKDQVPTPSYSCYEKYRVKLTGLDTSRPFAWSPTSVTNILDNETYLGVTVNMKTTTISYKNKKTVKRPESEQFRFEGTHEALVDRQTWDIVRENRRHKRRYTRVKEPSLFSGLLPQEQQNHLFGPRHPGV